MPQKEDEQQQVELEEEEEEEEEEGLVLSEDEAAPEPVDVGAGAHGDADPNAGGDIEERRLLELEQTLHVGAVPSACASGAPCRVGIDEAGRGPVLGPLVYGLAYWPVSESSSIESLGFHDSKQLSDAQREAMLALLQRENARIGTAHCELSAEHISAQMLLRRPVSLNELSFQATASMLRGVMAAGVNIAELLVDAVGNCEVYQRRLQAIVPGAVVTVMPRADALHKVVGAASILAKVTRDRTLRTWRCREPAVPPPQGSGYPGDERTLAWLREAGDPVLGLPSVVRHSWRTARDMYGEGEDAGAAAESCSRFVRADWEELEAGQVSLMAAFGPKQTKWHRERRLERVAVGL